MMYNSISNNPNERSGMTHPWVYWDDVFTSDELRTIINYCDKFDLSYGSTFGSSSKEASEKHRVSNVNFHHKNDGTFWIFERLNGVLTKANNEYYGFDLNGYESFQYTTYNESQRGHYDWHMDSEIGHDCNNLGIRKLSLTLQLNDEFEGGEFQINSGKESTAECLPSKKGRCLIFPSFMIHRVAPVTKGVRRSLVIWVIGPKFK